MKLKNVRGPLLMFRASRIHWHRPGMAVGGTAVAEDPTSCCTVNTGIT